MAAQYEKQIDAARDALEKARAEARSLRDPDSSLQDDGDKAQQEAEREARGQERKARLIEANEKRDGAEQDHVALEERIKALAVEISQQQQKENLRRREYALTTSGLLIYCYSQV